MPKNDQFLATQRERLSKLTKQPLNSAPPVRVEGSKATVRMYQDIDDFGGDWGVSATEFAAEIEALPDTVDTIELRINSRGGMVFDAVTIVNVLRAHPARTVAVVEGLAASAASFIAASADETVMMPNTRMMLHAAWGVAIGNAGDMRATADLLDALTQDIAEIYAAKTGDEVSAWLDRLAEDRWYSAQEAVEAGLADRVEAPESSSSDDEGDAKASVFDPSLSLALLDL